VTSLNAPRQGMKACIASKGITQCFASTQLLTLCLASGPGGSLSCLQDRLQRCVQRCQDKAQEMLSAQPSQKEIEKAQNVLASCAADCAQVRRGGSGRGCVGGSVRGEWVAVRCPQGHVLQLQLQLCAVLWCAALRYHCAALLLGCDLLHCANSWPTARALTHGCTLPPPCCLPVPLFPLLRNTRRKCLSSSRISPRGCSS